ncbi:MAG: acetolactate synthase large subunit [bacterium]|nr:acetolactate synthase large subunit [bacterium]MCP5066438.1 acetolactate synthase large subunit [bacterium]
MNGAETMIRTATQAGIEVCFANPGTTEMPLVAALDSVLGMRAVLGVFEGVCTGAADGYGRMTGRPALTVLHLGPGFANGIANLHNARRAHTPVVNLVGDQASWHLAADAPLTSDIASLARPVGWVHEVTGPRESARATASAIAASLGPPGQVATLIVPADAQWEDAESAPAEVAEPQMPALDEARIASLAETIHGADRCVLLLGGQGLGEAGLRAAHRLAASGLADVMIETFCARIERGAGLPDFPRLPYFPEQAVEALAGTTHLVLAGALSPVAFFGYPEGQSRLCPASAQEHCIAQPGEDIAGALTALADRLGADTHPKLADAPRPEPAHGPLDPASLGRTLAALQPDGAIVVDEAATTGFGYTPFAANALPHTTLGLTGGAIGQGLPCATGAAIACPDRPVIAFQADGSGLFTIQALWTQAREQLDVTTVICANRSYRILQVELARAGIAEPGPNALSLTDLRNPEIGWTHAAEAFGVPGTRVETAEAFAQAFLQAQSEPGPHLIEALL